jgi:hypothetical protein
MVYLHATETESKRSGSAGCALGHLPGAFLCRCVVSMLPGAHLQVQYARTLKLESGCDIL